jgi:hypothetical protein
MMVWAAISWYSLGPIITLHSRINAREYVDMLGNLVHPTMETLFPNKDTVFQDDNAPVHTAGTVSSWLEIHVGELQHLPWPAQLPGLNIIEPLCSVFGTSVRNRFPPLKQLEDRLQEELHKIPLKTVQNLCESSLRRNTGCIEGKRWSNHMLIKKSIR